MKIDKIKVYALEIVLLTILSFTLFVSNSYSRLTLAILFAVCAIVTWFFIKKRKVESVDSKKVTIILLLMGAVYLGAFYLMGLYFGYYKATLPLSWWSFTRQIIPIAIIIVASEMMRNVLVAQNTKFSKFITLVIMVLVDCVLYIDSGLSASFENIRDVIGFTIFASIANNLLFNHTTFKYGMKGIILYRFITVLYTYIIPYIPNVHVYLRAILRMLYPYIVYQVLEYTFTKNKNTVAIEDKRKGIISKAILTVFMLAVAMIVSCEFKYGAMVIVTGSMADSINVGDAIVFEAYEGQKVEVGQVLIFNKNNLRTVHRVVDVKQVNSETRYITKGDANEEVDDGYITKDEILGLVNFRVPKVGYPSIWFRDIISK